MHRSVRRSARPRLAFRVLHLGALLCLACGGQAIEDPIGIGGTANGSGGDPSTTVTHPLGGTAGTGGVSVGGSVGTGGFSTGGQTGVGGLADGCAGATVRGTGSDALIDDFEDGDPILRAVDGRVGGWWVAGDTGCTLDPSNPPTPEFGGASGSALALHVSAAGCDDWGFSTGVSLNSTSPLACAYDAKAYDGVYFWARTAVAPLSVQVAVNTRQTIPLAYGGDGTCGDACWNSYSIWFDVDPTWRLYAFTWAELAQQPGWGTAVPFDVTAIEQITWGATAAQTVNPRADLWIDQVNFVLGPVPLPPPNL